MATITTAVIVSSHVKKRPWPLPPPAVRMAICELGVRPPPAVSFSECRFASASALPLPPKIAPR